PDCKSAVPLKDIQGNVTFAVTTSMYVYVHLMDGFTSNNECGTYTLAGADPQTFIALDQFYAKDKNSVWFIADPAAAGGPSSYQISGADASTFTLIRDPFLSESLLHEGFSWT